MEYLAASVLQQKLPLLLLVASVIGEVTEKTVYTEMTVLTTQTYKCEFIVTRNDKLNTRTILQKYLSIIIIIC